MRLPPRLSHVIHRRATPELIGIRPLGNFDGFESDKLRDLLARALEDHSLAIPA